MDISYITPRKNHYLSPLFEEKLKAKSEFIRQKFKERNKKLREKSEIIEKKHKEEIAKWSAWRYNNSPFAVNHLAKLEIFEHGVQMENRLKRSRRCKSQAGLSSCNPKPKILFNLQNKMRILHQSKKNAEEKLLNSPITYRNNSPDLKFGKKRIRIPSLGDYWKII
ncbi:unnamed protein product [Blepharisma stoltei]|uniref:Uncharacterized protein n=1 Tax=Blepharisma stoltei TaxID=1481888 RepID=A0AAU9JRL5_9CILI|nr:unnamed protein product [Blepharisma stoltei]